MSDSFIFHTWRTLQLEKSTIFGQFGQVLQGCLHSFMLAQENRFWTFGRPTSTANNIRLKLFNLRYRCVDDPIVFNYKKFYEYVWSIYSSQLLVTVEYN